MIDFFLKLGFESKLYQTEWNGISLMEIARSLQLPISEVAADHFYDEFYQRLKSNGFVLDPDFIENRLRLSERMLDYVQRQLRHNMKSRFLSLGAGLGVVEEPLLRKGISIDLQECQESSFSYLDRQDISFDRYIGSDLSVVPSQTYDLIFVFGVSYVFSLQEYKDFMKQCQRILVPGGKVLLWDYVPQLKRLNCFDFLRVRKFLLTCFGKFPARVFWGWGRLPYLHRHVACHAGFMCEEQFFTTSQFELSNSRGEQECQWFLFRRL